MNPGIAVKLKRSLTLHEGWKSFPYVDTVGKITIGCGYNLTDRGLPEEWINSQYNQDVEFFYSKLFEFSWFNKLNDDRKIVLIDMSFMGWKRFLSFKKMIAYLEKLDYEGAAEEMKNSLWYEQVKKRGQDLYQGMLTGVYNV